MPYFKPLKLLRGKPSLPHFLCFQARGKVSKQVENEVVAVSVKTFVRDLLTYAPAKIILALLAFAATAIFTRLFTPDSYGAYALVLAIVNPILVITTEWAAQPIGRFYSEYRAGKFNDYPSAMGAAVCLVLLASLLAAGITGGLMAHYWGVGLSIGVAVLLVLQSLHNVILPVLPASFDRHFYNAVEIARAATGVLLSLVLVYWLGPRPACLIWGTTLAIAFVLPVMFWRLKKHTLHLPAPVLIVPELRRFALYGLPFTLWFFAAQMLSIGDRYVIQIFRGSEEVGIYSASYNFIVGIASLLGAPLTLASFPIIMRVWADRKKAEVQRIISGMTGIHILLGAGLVGLIYSGGVDALSIALGSSFREGKRIMLPVLAGQLFWQASMLGQKGLELMEKTYLMPLLALVAAGINFGLNLLFVPGYGYIAAAYTTLASYALYCFLVWLSTRNLIPWQVPLKDLFGAALAGFAGVGLVWISAAKLPASFLGNLARAAFFGFVYLALITIWKHREFAPFFGRGRKP